MSPLWLLAVSLTAVLSLLEGDPVTNYTITVTSGPQFSTWLLYPEPGCPNIVILSPSVLASPEGKLRGASATNLSCWIHHVDFLDCSWAVGPAAPVDIQYHLFFRKPFNYKNWTCEQYSSDARGIHTGCSFQGLSHLNPHFYQFVVTGRSEVGPVACTEKSFNIWNIEILPAPELTGKCNASHSVLEWTPVSHFIGELCYELLIQRGPGLSQTEKVSVHVLCGVNGMAPEARTLEVLTVLTRKVQVRHTCSYVLVNPGTHTVQIRAKDSMGLSWSPWSTPRHFECDQAQERGLQAWHVALCVVLGTMLLVLLLALLFRRFSVMQRLFPPIPGMKDSVRDLAHMDKLATWDMSEGSLENCPVEELQVVYEK
ncbi:interleukin-3 receptor subunit alpha [Rhynchocyon petersi]